MCTYRVGRRVTCELHKVMSLSVLVLSLILSNNMAVHATGDRVISEDAPAGIHQLPPSVHQALLTDQQYPGRVEDSVVNDAYHSFLERASGWAQSAVKQNWEPYIESKFSPNEPNESCKRDIRRLLTSFANLDSWAVQVMDSWGKFPPSGIMEGTWSDFGAYYECLETDIPQLDSGRQVWPQYCTVEYRPLMPARPPYQNILHPLVSLLNITSNLSDKHVLRTLAKRIHFSYYMPFRLGICTPSSCSTADVDHLVKQVGLDLVLHGRVARCELPQNASQQPLNGGQWCAIALLIVFGLLCAYGTWLDTSGRKRRSGSGSKLVSWQRILTAFSVPRNFYNIFHTSSSSSELTCIHGLRVIMISWIIMGHTFLWINYTAFGRSFEIINMITPLAVQPLFHVNIAVDAFFFMSGLLTTYSTWKVVPSKKSFNSWLFILARYWRVTPTFFATIILTFLVPLLSSGPTWHEMVDPVVEGCQSNWWINLLYLHNWFNMDNICLLHTWYLANDMQFHIASLVVVWALLRNKRLGLIINGLAIVGFTVSSFLITYLNDYPPYSITTQPEVEERWEYVLYFKFRPWVHGGAFCVGLWIGFLLAKEKMMRFSRMQLTLGWSFTVSAFAIVMFGVYPWNNGQAYSGWLSALYSSTHRTLWALGIGWIVLVCSNGQGGFVNSILSWKPFIPLGRICYSIYLSHGWFIMLFMGSVRQRLDASFHFGLYMFIGHWFLSIAFSFFFAVVFESPFLAIQKDILSSYARSRESLGVKVTHHKNIVSAANVEASVPLTLLPATNNNHLIANGKDKNGCKNGATH